MFVNKINLDHLRQKILTTYRDGSPQILENIIQTNLKRVFIIIIMPIISEKHPIIISNSLKNRRYIKRKEINKYFITS